MLGKTKEPETVVMVAACPGCKKRCCESLSAMQAALKKERKKRKKLEKRLKLKAGKQK